MPAKGMEVLSSVNMTAITTNHQVLGYRKAFTHCGVALDVFKSALQKSARRCETQNAAWFAQEIIMVKKLSDPNNKSAKAIHTNLINRLKVIAIEDVSPRCVGNVNDIFKYLDDWCIDERVIGLAKAIQILFSVKKLRVCSHLRILVNALTDSEDKDNLTDTVSSALHHYSQEKLLNEFFNPLFLADMSERGRSILANVVAIIYRKAFNLPHTTPLDKRCLDLPKIVTRSKKKIGFKLLWESLMRVGRNYPELRQNIELKRKMFEARGFFQEEIFCLLSAVESTCATLNDMTIPPISFPNRSGVELEAWSSHNKPQFESHVYDKHVRGGNRSLSFFAHQGAAVVNEDEEWALPRLRAIYTRMRSQESSGEKRPKRKLVVNSSSSSSPSSSTISSSKSVASPKKLKRREDDVDDFDVRDDDDDADDDDDDENDEHNDDDDVNKDEEVDDDKTLYLKGDFSSFQTLKCCTPNSRKGITVLVKNTKNNEQMIVKEMRPSINLGKDQLAAYTIKRDNILVLKSLHCTKKGHLVKSSTAFHRNDSDNRNPGKKGGLYTYFISDCIGNVSDVDVRATHNRSSMKEILKTDEGIQCLVSILIFRTILGVTDTNMTNILLDEGSRLYSVDENSIGNFPLEESLSKKPVKRLLEIIQKYKAAKPDTCLKDFFPDWFHDDVVKEILTKNLVSELRNNGISSRHIDVVVNNLEKIENIENILSH